MAEPASPSASTPPEVAPSDPGTEPATAPISRRRARVYAALAVASTVAGCAVYALAAPDLDIVDVELGAAPWPWPAGVAEVVGWDVVLIAGYAGGLMFGLLLAKAVFGRAALTEWPTLETARGKRRRRHTWQMAWLVGGAAALAVLADLTENLLLLIATRSTDEPRRLIDAITAVAVVKFCALAPSAAVAILGIVCALVRSSRALPPRLDDGDTQPPSPPPATGPPAGTGASPSTAAQRWARGYVVPGLDPATVTERALRGPTVGICLSGGGVRSASVALGAMQAMRRELQEADYLVSVSGGGYTAGALQLALTDAIPPEVRAVGEPVRDPASVLLPGTVEEDHVRRHASYIADGAGQLTLALGVVARGLLLSLFVLFGPAVVLGWVVGRVWTLVPLAPWTAGSMLPWNPELAAPGVRTGTLLALATIVGLAGLAFLVALWQESSAVGVRTVPRAVAAALVLLALLVAGLAIGVPMLVFVAAEIAQQGNAVVATAGLVGSVLLSYAATLVAVARKRADGGDVLASTRRALRRAPAGALRSLLVVLTLVVLVAAWLLVCGGIAAVASEPTTTATVVVVAILLAPVLAFVDIPAMSLHPFYRRRLASAFAVRRVRVGSQVVPLAYEFAENTRLSVYGSRLRTDDRPDGDPQFPEVVFAAAANLTGEQRAPLAAVGFTFSGGWIGGPDVGYVRTAALEKGEVTAPQLAADLTVEAAVALSGAAFSSSMGRMSGWYGRLLAVTGARLGSWLPNPSFVRGASMAAEQQDWTVPRLPRIRRLPYLLREVFGVHRCDDRLLQITDGGHYENLGLVELLRRRCDRISCIDASGDSPPTADRLRQALTLAYEELGVVFHGSEATWGLVPGSGEALTPAGPLAPLNNKLARTATLRLTFTYPPESGRPEGTRSGTLVVAKAVLTPDMGYPLLARGASDPLFPRDPTSDQFFDDDKYCSYTELGRELGRAAVTESTSLAAALVDQGGAGKAERPAPVA